MHTHLMAALYLGNLGVIGDYILKSPKEKDESDKGAGILQSACSTGHVHIVSCVLEYKADVKARRRKHRNLYNINGAERTPHDLKCPSRLWH